MRLAASALRLSCSDVLPRSSIVTKKESVVITTSTLSAGASQCRHGSTFICYRPSFSNDTNYAYPPHSSIRSFTSSSRLYNNDKAIEERLQRLKQDFEAQKAAEEAKKKAEAERLRKEQEAREAKERAEREAQERKQREEKEAKEREEQAAREAAARTQAAAPRGGRLQNVHRQPLGVNLGSAISRTSSQTEAKDTRLDPSRIEVPTPRTSTVSTRPRSPPPTTSTISSSNDATATAAAIPPNGRADLTSWTQNLPSHTANLRFEMTKRFHRYMEHLLELAALYSHRLNTYTGTDYSGISALRAAISSQEQLVRAALKAVDNAKDDYSDAFAAQSASQKEVVQLLERKHSWSSSDLERYMALIRSEHVNEQRVQRAKESLGEKEKALEEARAQLEKSERRQYHEEQIWSDTIRRNSTWVTFGLMGFNIFLLLASLLVFEPWRRRRLVREIRSALDEKAVVSGTSGDIDVTAVPSTTPAVIPALEAVVDAATEPKDESLEQIKNEVPPALDAETVTVDSTGSVPTVLDARPALPDTGVSTPASTADSAVASLSAADAITSETAEDFASTSQPSTSSSTPPQTFPWWGTSWSDTLTLYRAYWADLFSERTITLKRYDLTATALEGAAAGAAFVGLLVVLLFPRGSP